MKMTNAYLNNGGMRCGAFCIGVLRETMNVSVSTRGRCAVTSGGRANGTGTFVLVYDERTDEAVLALRLDEMIELRLLRIPSILQLNDVSICCMALVRIVHVMLS